MPKKGNGVDLTNDYLRQILEKLGEVLVSQEGMRGEQEAMRVQIGNIEGAVRQIAYIRAGREASPTPTEYA